MEAVERSVTVPTSPDETWDLVADPDELGMWLGAGVTMDDPEPGSGTQGEVVDDDGAKRSMVIDDVEAGRRISWYWWTDDDTDGGMSHVQVTVLPDDDGGSRVTVIEQPVAASPRTLQAHAAVTTSVWDFRLLHLQLRALLLMSSAVAV